MTVDIISSPLVSTDKLEDMLANDRASVVLIDTRPPEMWASGHIAGAVNMHDIFTYLATSTQTGNDQMRTKFAQLFGKAGLGGDETAVVYEDQMDTGFGQSCRGYVILRYLGYPADKVKILDGGIHAWKVQGKPIVGAEAMGTATHFSHAPKTFPQSSAGESLLIGRDEFLQIVQDTLNHSTPTILIDTRDEPEWMGKTSSPYGLDFCPRMGRIPGAHWIEWKRMMEKNEAGVAHIKNPEEVLNICGEFQIGPETPVVVFCFKGARASNTLVALQDAGVKDVRLYMGSWNEWSRDPALPIVEVA